MKKTVLPIIFGTLMLVSGCSEEEGAAKPKASEEKKTVKVGISQLVEHPSLDASREGFVAALEESGYKEGDNLKLDFQNAQGDMNNNMTIAQKLINDKNDLILAISTPSAQPAVKSTKDIPILFTAVTDPVLAKLVDTIEKPGGNVTGTSDTKPEAIELTINSIKDLFPDAKTIGVLYNPGEENSVIYVEKAKEIMKESGLEVVEGTVANSSEVQQAAESVVDRSDVILVAKDNTVVSALESVIKVANKKKVPTFAGEHDSVKRGIFAAYGFEYYDLGYKTGKMAVDILEGKKPADIEVGYPDDLQLGINEQTAKEIGVEIPEDMKDKVKMIK